MRERIACRNSPPIYLTTRPDLGDVSQGRLATIDKYYEPPYLHDGRLLTLEDTVEFFNVVTGTKLTEQEKADLVAFMRTL